MSRRRLAVAGVIGTALVGEWLGHGLAYYRSGGAAGLGAGLAGGIHAYMLPLAAALLVVAVAGTAWLARAWLELGRRLDAAAALLARLRAGQRPEAVAIGSRNAAPARRRRRGPSGMARVLALALLLGALQCGLFLAQENLERVLQGVAAAGLAPLVDAAGAATWIQLGVAGVLAALLAVCAGLLRSRELAVERVEGAVRVLCQRTRVAIELASPPAPTRVVAAPLLLGSAVWQRPPPVCSAA